MAEKRKKELNEAQIVAYLQEIVERIKSDEDPLELNAYRRLFKKAVPFYLRSYFAGYLVKLINSGKFPGKIGNLARNDRFGKSGRGDRNERGDRTDRGDRSDRSDRSDKNERSGRGDRSARDNERSARSDRNDRGDEHKRGKGSEGRQEGRGEQAKAEPRQTLPDDVSTTLFISIGRNRRVFPRDLIGLIMQNVEMDRDHVGDIRVLDNYSFVQVITEDAEKIIAALNEFEYRGRKLAVSFSRKKEDSASVEALPSDEAIPESDEVIPESEEEDDDYSEPEDDLVDGMDSEEKSSWLSETDPLDDEEDNGDIK